MILSRYETKESVTHTHTHTHREREREREREVIFTIYKRVLTKKKKSDWGQSDREMGIVKYTRRQR